MQKSATRSSFVKSLMIGYKSEKYVSKKITSVKKASSEITMT